MQQSEMICQQQVNFTSNIFSAEYSTRESEKKCRLVAQTPLVRFVVDLLYDKFYSKSTSFRKVRKKSTTSVCIINYGMHFCIAHDRSPQQVEKLYKNSTTNRISGSSYKHDMRCDKAFYGSLWCSSVHRNSTDSYRPSSQYSSTVTLTDERSARFKKQSTIIAVTLHQVTKAILPVELRYWAFTS
jgi:hypothetical protein